MKDTAILVTTFLRDNALFDCVRSIRKHYPDVAIYIVDTGNESKEKSKFCTEHKCVLIQHYFDAGVTSAKNEGMRQIPRKYKYVFLCEDDIKFTDETKLEDLREILEKRKDIGLAGCLLKKVKQSKVEDQEYEGTLYIKDDTIYVKKLKELQWKKIGSVKYMLCDIITNVFMIRHKIWNQIKWDEQYKTTPEHTDFFLLLKYNTSWKVAFTDSSSMEHHAQFYKTHDYSVKRMRTFGYKVLAEKWGVKYYSNDWNESWGIKNPMSLYTFASLRPSEELRRLSLLVSVEKKKFKVAIGIKTFMREDNFFKVIDSIEKHFPLPYRLYIADDSGEISGEKEYLYQRLRVRGHVIIKLPFNSGLSAGRNAIINKVKEDYILMTDDDIGLTDSVSIENMKKVLDSSEDIGICAGMIYQENGEYFGGENYSRGLKLEIDRKLLFRSRAEKNLSKTNGIIFNYADQVVNFFLAKREVFNDITWDSRIKVEYEHVDFFLNLKKTKWRATVCLDTKFIHFRSLREDSLYNQYRRSAPLQYFYAKHSIGNIVNRYLQQGARR